MWVWLVTGVPTVWMYAMSSWALVIMIRQHFDLMRKANFAWEKIANPVPWIAIVLLVLALVMLAEAIRVILGSFTRPGAKPSVLTQPSTYEARPT